MKPLVAAFALILCIAAAPAAAMPGDPPIVPRSPADGATVPPDAAGVPVTFDCPKYIIAVFGTGSSEYRQGGDHTDYTVRFSSSPALGADGRLAPGFNSGGGVRLNDDGVTCTQLLDTYDGADSPEIFGGRVYWQVDRFCNGCGGNQRELSPIQSFVIASPRLKATLKTPARAYAGYLGLYTFRSAAPLSGADVALQRRVGKRWKTLDTRAFSTAGTQLLAKLPAGRQRVRTKLTTSGGRTLIGTQRTLTVRRGGSRTTSARDDGAYAAVRPKGNRLKFTVARGGTRLTGFSASVTMFCFPTANISDNRIQIGFAGLRTVPIAPDGTVVGVLETKDKGGRVQLSGRLRNGRFQGTVKLAFSPLRCSGTRKLDARRR